uniref:Putative secreted protein n=1 Tax=Anopheles darlingi TaxID=43151 RepID=A0A2M4D8L9_ANODA
MADRCKGVCRAGGLLLYFFVSLVSSSFVVMLACFGLASSRAEVIVVSRCVIYSESFDVATAWRLTGVHRPRNIDTRDGFHQFRYFVNDLQHFAGQFYRTDLTITARDHRDLLGLRQWRGHFGSNLR